MHCVWWVLPTYAPLFWCGVALNRDLTLGMKNRFPAVACLYSAPVINILFENVFV